MPEKKLTTKVYNFDLTGGAIPTANRKYCVVVLNYGFIRENFKPEIYNVETGNGEQRQALVRRVGKLRKAFINNRFTPTSVEACVLPENIESIINDNVTIKFDGEKIPLLNGQQRFEALESIRDENLQTQR